ncbi:MAG TPA: hypothetical protein PKY87_08055, partial [Terricaulis sp.]|nr:hypothetical protein [Terricaulis sp.]
TRGGDNQGVDMGEMLWACDFSTTQLTREIAGQYKWLRAALDGFQGTLFIYDAERRRPLHYFRGGDWGAPMVASVSRANKTMTFSGFKPGAVIAPGDYGHWQDGPARRLHIVGGGVADGSGNLTMSVRPAPPTTPTATLPVPFVMEEASAEMIVPKFDVPFSAPASSQATLTAVQVIRRF